MAGIVLQFHNGFARLALWTTNVSVDNRYFNDGPFLALAARKGSWKSASWSWTARVHSVISMNGGYARVTIPSTCTTL
jgi:hypothetical protein